MSLYSLLHSVTLAHHVLIFNLPLPILIFQYHNVLTLQSLILFFNTKIAWPVSSC